MLCLYIYIYIVEVLKTNVHIFFYACTVCLFSVRVSKSEHE